MYGGRHAASKRNQLKIFTQLDVIINGKGKDEFPDPRMDGKLKSQDPEHKEDLSLIHNGGSGGILHLNNGSSNTSCSPRY